MTLSSQFEADKIVNRAWSAGMQPPPDLELWEWMDQNVLLGTDSDNKGNQYESERTAYVRGIAECLGPNHPAIDVTVMKGSQLGLTTLAIGWVGYIVDLMPAPLLITLPSEGVAREWSTQRLSQFIEQTKVLQGKILESKKRLSGNTTFSKRFSGNYFMKIAWSSSAAKLRSTPAKFLASDEVDGFEGDTEGEGDPVELLNRRSTNFQGAKHFKISTPTDAENSRILREFLKGDQRYYFIPCPKCGHYQPIFHKQLRWEKGRYDTVRLICIGCGHAIEEHHKTKMLSAGMWVATATHKDVLDQGFKSVSDPKILEIQQEMATAERVSFHLNSFYSPIGWYSWERGAQEWEAAQKSPSALKVYVMTVMGEVWNNLGEAPKWESLYERRKTTYDIGTAPQGVLFCTVGVDVQKDRMELEIVGWGRNLRSWSIGYEKIAGEPTDPATWRRLEEYLARPVPHECGAELPIWVVGVDSGNWARNVYDVVQRHQQPYVTPAAVRIVRPGTWIATKGGHRFDKLLETVSNEDASRKRGGVKVFTIGTGFAKLEWYEWLNGKPVEVDGAVIYPDGYPEFPDYQPAWFQGVVSERLQVSDRGTRKFVPDPAVRNEPLDIRLISRLGAHLMVPPRVSLRESFWRKLERELADLTPRQKKRTMPTEEKRSQAGAPIEVAGAKKFTAPKPKYSGGGWIDG